MGYILGPNYLKANKRWLGIKRDNKIIIDECSSITVNGATYYWAPCYKSFLECTGSNLHDFLFGETTPYASNIPYGNEELTIYKVMNQWCAPSFAMNASDYQFNDPTAIQNSEFHTLDGQDIIINSSDSDKPLSECDRLPLIIPGVSIYAICCSKTGAYSEYRNPFIMSGGGYSNNSPKPGRILFNEKWNLKVGSAPPFRTNCELNLQGAQEVAPIALSPTYFRYQNASGNPVTQNYQNSENGLYFRQETSASVPYRIIQACSNNVRWTPGSSKVTDIYAGQMLQDTASTEYNFNNATHFQLVYRPSDIDIDANTRFWGYVAVIDELKLENRTL